jgi:hypothetical protein
VDLDAFEFQQNDSPLPGLKSRGVSFIIGSFRKVFRIYDAS